MGQTCCSGMLGGLLILTVFAVFGQIWWYGFLNWDDDLHVTENPHLHPLTWGGMLRFWTQPYQGLYIPLSYTLFGIETFLARLLFDAGPEGGLDPRPFRAGSLLLHALCTLLVFRILRQLTRHPGAACCGALLFALHPVQVESVAWISETRGLLAALFSLAAVWLSVRGRRAGGKAGRVEEGTGERVIPSSLVPHVHDILATVAFTLAMLSKPSAVAVLPIVLILDLLILRRPLRKSLATLSIWGVVAVLLVWLTRQEQSDILPVAVAPLWARPLIAADALSFYLQKFFFPWGLAFDYGRSPATVMASPWIYLAWLVPAGVAAGLWLLRAGAVWWGALGIFLAGVLPVLGLIPFTFQYISTVADRYLYLSMLGPALAMAAWLSRGWKPRRIGIAAVLLCAMAVLSHRQTSFWRDNETLYARGLQINPHSAVAYHNLGHDQMVQGNFDQAVSYLRRAVELEPEYGKTRYQFGLALLRRGDVEQAKREFRKSLHLDPHQEKAHYDLAVVLDGEERLEEAVAHYQAALIIKPDYAAAHNNLGNVLQRQGKMDEAAGHYRAAIAARPEFASPRVNLGNLLLVEGDVRQAVRQFEAALKLDPNLDRVHFNLGLVRTQEGRLKEAETHFESVLRLAPDDVDAHFNLAVVYEQQGFVTKAAEQYEQAIHSEPSHVRSHLNLGNLRHTQQRWDDSIRHFEAAIESDPGFSMAYNNLGLVLHDLERYDEAIIQYRAALKLDPMFAPAYYNLAQSLYEQGDIAGAIENLRKALSLVPETSEPAREIREKIRLYRDRM
jgi:protein O-mannosyl-transferase